MAPEPSPTPELDVHLVLSATWLEDGDAPGSDPQLGASQLAARMAMLKARRTGVAVELREHVRAKQGVMGREPSTKECRADEWWAAMCSEASSAAVMGSRVLRSKDFKLAISFLSCPLALHTSVAMRDLLRA